MEESATCEDGEKACSGVRRRQGRREGDWLGLGPPGSYLVIYLFGGFIPDFLTEFKISPLGLIFSLSSKAERKEENDGGWEGERRRGREKWQCQADCAEFLPRFTLANSSSAFSLKSVPMGMAPRDLANSIWRNLPSF